MRQASRSCQSFALALRESLDAYLGARGAPDHMTRLREAAVESLDWERLVKGTPTLDMYKAFLVLAALLRPALCATLWPLAGTFPHVERSWPSERGPRGWFQHQLLSADAGPLGLGV